MNGHTNDDFSDPGKDQQKPSAPAKRFVFDVSENQSRRSSSFEASKSSKSSLLLKSFPIIDKFTAPKDFKEAYNDICEYTLAMYNEIRRVIVSEYIEIIQHSIKDVKLETPIDCMKLFKGITLECFEKIKESGIRSEGQRGINEYEKMLQQSELKIRDLIRNEQIYRLNFEQLTTRGEEAERAIASLTEKIMEKNVTLENLTKEVATLSSSLKRKDEEMRILLAERQAFFMSNSNVNATTSPAESPSTVEHQRGKTNSWNATNFKMLLNDHRLTPAEFAKLVPNIQTSRGLSNLKKSANKTPTSSTMKSGPNLFDLTPGNMKNLNLNNIEKFRDVKEALKNNVDVHSNRKKPHPPQNYGSEQQSPVSANFFSSARGATPEQSRSKPLPRAKIVTETTGRFDEKSNSPLRVKQTSDVTNIEMRTDFYEDPDKTPTTFGRADRVKLEELDRKGQLRMEGSHNSISNYRRNSGITRTRPQGDSSMNSQKSLEQKSNLVNSRQSGVPLLAEKNLLKTKSSIFENRNSRMSKNMSPPMNVMLKKFADQELNAKKIF